MKIKNKKPLKILAGVIAITLIGGMLFITNAFVGNPISAMKANKDIKQYVNKNYSHLDLDVGKATYDFKNGGYMARATSKTSIDTKFAVYHYDGKVQRDDYKDYVLGMFNTLDRLSNEYSALATDVISKELGYEDVNITVMYDKDNYGKFTDDLELDIKFDKALPLNPEVHIQLALNDLSIEEVANIFISTHNVFIDNGFIFTKYGLFADDDPENIMVIGVTPAQIESGDLVNLLKIAEMYEDTTIIGKDGDKEPSRGSNEIFIYRKGEVK